MSKQYTAQEMRKAATTLYKRGDELMTEEMLALSAMLSQAADAEEENAQLKARLEAVVKEIDMRICHPSESNCKRCGDHRGNCQCGSLSNNGMMKLLKLAKGE